MEVKVEETITKYIITLDEHEVEAIIDNLWCQPIAEQKFGGWSESKNPTIALYQELKRLSGYRP